MRKLYVNGKTLWKKLRSSHNVLCTLKAMSLGDMNSSVLKTDYDNTAPEKDCAVATLSIIFRHCCLIYFHPQGSC